MALLPRVPIVLAIASAFALSGCPRDPATLERPASATPCTSDADCNPDGENACGLIRACVDQRCEATPTRTIHCP